MLRYSFVFSQGLSPRVRGNPAASMGLPTCERSIPARAGEPWARSRMARSGRVYPRACGGTVTGGYDVYVQSGLSPRVRGNRTSPGRGCGR